MNLTVRVDVSPEIGWGHWTRCQALVSELEKTGRIRTTFVARNDNLPASVPPAEEGAWIRRHLPYTDVLLADLYHPTQEQIASLCVPRWKSVFIDDDAPHLFACDLLVNPNLSSEFTPRFAPYTHYLHGAAAILLREQFADCAPRVCRPKVRHLLLAFGGSDPTDLTGRVCREIQCRFPGGLFGNLRRVTIVLGAGYACPEKIHALAARADGWQVLQDVPDMAALMQAADLAILAGGTQMYEAAATGLPALIFPVNPTQYREAIVLAEHGAVLLAEAPETAESRLPFPFYLLTLASSARRQQMAERGQALLDGKGRLRIAEAVWNLYAERERLPCAA